MSSNATDLAPWKHPKAQAWFRALFRRTNLPLALENELRQPDDQLSLPRLRMMLALVLLLGRDEIWPKHERDILKAVLKRIRKRIQMPLTSVTGKPLSVAEHQEHNRVIKALEQEIELVRRRLGISFRKTPMKTPDTWGKFWE